MGFVDKSDRMVNSYGTAHRTRKWTKKLFFHLTDMTILNAFLIHKSCGGKMKHKNFHEILVRELVIHSQEENVTASGISSGRPSPTVSQWTGSKAFTALAFQRKTTAVLHMFAAEANTEHAVFLLEVCRWSVCSELLQQMVHACELESLDTKRRVDSANVRQIISLYSADRKHLPCKKVLYACMYVTSHMPAV